MDKTIAGLLGAMGALAVAGPGHAAPLPASSEAVLQARSYSDLLRPVTNAVETLRALDSSEAQVVPVQLNVIIGNPHHHHHHHHRYVRRRYHHHHHDDYYDRREGRGGGGYYDRREGRGGGDDYDHRDRRGAGVIIR